MTREAFLKTWGRGRLLTKIDVSHEPVFLLAAVSGGRDSVLLLEALSDLVEQDMLAEGSELVICHVHHGIREQASRDAAFVQDLAERKGLRFILQMGSAPALAQKGKRGLEAAARQLRYAAFVSCLEDEGFQPLNGDSSVRNLYRSAWQDDMGRRAYVLLAHHGGDQAESILLNIQRGSGLSGLTGMQEKQGCLRRPWLELATEQVDHYCRMMNLQHIEDLSNQDRSYTRNRIRLDLLPLWDELAGHSMEQKLLELSRRIRRDEAYWQAQTNEQLSLLADGYWVIDELDGEAVLRMVRAAQVRLPDTSGGRGGGLWSRGIYAKLPDVYRIRTLQMIAAAEDSAYDLEARHYELMEAWVLEGGQGALDLPGRRKLVNEGERFSFLPAHYASDVAKCSMLIIEESDENTNATQKKHDICLQLLTINEDSEEEPKIVGACSAIPYNECYGKNQSNKNACAEQGLRTRLPGDTIPEGCLQWTSHGRDGNLTSSRRVGLRRFWKKFGVPAPLRDRVIFCTDQEDRIVAPAMKRKQTSEGSDGYI